MSPKKIRRLIAISLLAISSLTVNTLQVSATTVEPELSELIRSEGLSTEEAREFEQYVLQEEIFEEQVTTSPNIVAQPRHVDPTIPDELLDNPAGNNKIDADPFLSNEKSEDYRFAETDAANVEAFDPVDTATLNYPPRKISPYLAPGVTPNTTNPTPTADNRIGKLHLHISGNKYGVCTANHIGGKFWLTAHHCVDGLENSVGFIEQSDGEFAGVEAVYTKSPNYDIALIKVGSGIRSGTFDLSSTTAPRGKVLSIIGYAKGNDFSSKSTLSVIGHPHVVNYYERDKDDNPIRVIYTYYDLLRTVPVLPDKYIPAQGDSGAGVWFGNSLYGVHSGSSDISAVHADIVPHLDWVETTMRTKSRSSISEKLRAFRGGVDRNKVRVEQVIRLIPKGSSRP